VLSVFYIRIINEFRAVMKAVVRKEIQVITLTDKGFGVFYIFLGRGVIF